MSKITNETPGRRPRRATGESRELLLETARTLFAEQGFAGTSTRQIAAEAGVSEPLLFRYFGSKAGLFDAAMLESYDQFINDFMDQFHDDLAQPEKLEDLTRRFVEGLFDLMGENRRLFLALIAARAFEGGNRTLRSGLDESALSRQLGRFDQMLQTSGVTPRYLDSAVSFRLTVGVVMAAAVLDDWLFPAGPDRPQDDRILKELVQFTLYGVFGKRPRS